MDIIVGDCYSTTTELSVLPMIREYCRARPEGFYHMPKYRSGTWDGYISVMKGLRNFPTGLLPEIVQMLEKKGWHINLIDNTKTLHSREISESCLRGITLRDYQIAAASALIKAHRGIASMATNSGKTEVMAAVIWSLGVPKSLVLVHRKELMYQTARRLEKRLGCKVGIIGDGVHSRKNVTVAMIQTLSRSKDTAKEFSDNEVILVDECHHLSSTQMMDVLFKLSGSYRYGFSGTPLKYDQLSDLKLIAATGRILYETSNKYLIDKGYSAVPIVHMNIVESYNREEWELDYQEAYNRLIVNNEERNKIIANLAKSSRGVVLVLVNRIDHGNLLKHMIPSSVFVTGEDDSDYRNSVLDRMREAIPCVYIATPIYDEGVDVPSVDTIILAAGGKSHIKVLQRIGRGLRKKEGENILVVHDFLDDTNMHLFGHSQDRINTYAEQQFKTVVG